MYPRWVYHINEDVTRQNKARYDQMINKWYDKAEEMFPDFYQLDREHKKAAAEQVDKAIGYSRRDIS